MKLLRLLAPAVAAGALAFVPAASAEGPYTITSSGAYGSSAAETAFVGSGCNDAVGSSAVNGLDARILNISHRAGSRITINWTSPVPGGVGSLAATFYSPGCTRMGATIASPTAPGSWAVDVPGGARWISVASAGKANVTFTIG